MSELDPASKWDRIHSSVPHGQSAVSRILDECRHLLPASGAALDPACGKGDDAMLLAGLGLHTHAWDISQVAIDRLAATAAAAGLQLELEQRDAVARPPERESFDVIVVSHFLDRGLVPHLRRALRRGGLVYYQTFIKERLGDSGPHNPAYRLDANELLHLFAGLHIIYYREEGLVGNTDLGIRNQAMLVAQRRDP